MVVESILASWRRKKLVRMDEIGWGVAQRRANIC